MQGNIFISYLKERFKIIIAFVTFIVIFFIVYSLYHISFEPILYSSILVVTLAIIFSIYDFYKYYTNSIKVKSILKDFQYIENSLPESKCLLEQYYFELNIVILTQVKLGVVKDTVASRFYFHRKNQWLQCYF